MVNHKEIKQGSLEWFEIKWRKIGGTLSKGLFINSDTLFIDLLSQHIEEFEPSESYSNDAMERGNELEPFALQYISQYTGLNFQTTGWLQSKEYPLLGISPDGLTEDEETACEIKCLARKAHTEILLKNETPKDKISQIVHYFTVNSKLKKLYFISYRPESIKPFIEVFTPESIVDMGWKKKIEVKQFGVKGQEIKPKIENIEDLKTISQWSEIAKAEAKKLEAQIKETINKLNF